MMVDRITKSLRKLTWKEQKIFKKLLRQIQSGNVADLDVKKLKGSLPIYRVRKGDMRVMYRVSKEGKISLLAVERRSDTTYKKY